jgi:zinc transport system substrate-binding protein
MIRIISFVSLYAFYLICMYGQVEYVTTIHPFYELVNNIVGERGLVKEILPPGASPHTYELKGSDVKNVEYTTALIMGSPKLDNWAYRFHHPSRIELIPLIPKENLLYLEVKFGKHKGKTAGIDPHFWTDPLTVKMLIPELVKRLYQLDSNGCDIYEKNSQIFINQLDSLYQMIKEKLAVIENKSILLAHPFFQYYLKRFDFDLVGIIEIAEGTEPTPRELKEIIEIARDRKVKAIFTQKQHSDRAARIVAESTGTKVYELDPLGGVLDRKTYQEILLYNTQIILEALR